MATLSFAAAVDQWTRQTEERMTAVFRQSASDVISEAQRNAPVDTGFLRASLQVGINTGIVPASRENPGGAGYQAPAVDAVIAGAEIGDTITASYTANYAPFVEYGTSRMAPRRFVGRAVQRWQSIVSENINRLKSSAARL